MTKHLLTLLLGAAAVASAAASSSSSSASALTSSSHFHTPGLAAHHMHHTLIQEKLREFLPPPSTPRSSTANDDNDQKQRRRVQGDESSCPGTPFLWKIIDDDNGEHVGFAIGTMHLPADVVTTQEARTALGHALEDSCDVYGELNMVNANVTSDLQTCLSSTFLNAATVNDIPSPTLRASFQAKLLQITLEHIQPDPELAPTFASRIADLPLAEAQKIILYGNTPEYVDMFGHTLYSGEGGSLDLDMLKLGRPADDLEDVSTQCSLLESLNPSKDDFIQNFNDEVSAAIEESLDASLSKEIELYKCGDIDAFVEHFTAESLALDEVTEGAALTERNKNMAERINTILQSNPNERILFAVGVSHWLIGNSNLKKLLKEGYGYSMEHIPDWSKDMAEDHSHSHCEVIFDPELQLYLDNPPVPGAAPVEITQEPTHNLVPDTYGTNPPSPPVDGMKLISDSPTRKPTSSSSGTMIFGASKLGVAAIAGVFVLLI